MSTLDERVARAITESDVPIRSIAAAVGVSVQSVYAWRNGKVKDLRNDNLFALADATGFEARWIGTGDGPERSLAATNHRIKDLMMNYAKCDERGKDNLLLASEREAAYSTKDTA
jgi:transcriptional regulator with XRE-family HTH domain